MEDSVSSSATSEHGKLGHGKLEHSSKSTRVFGDEIVPIDGVAVVCKNLTKTVQTTSLYERVLWRQAPEQKVILDNVSLCARPGQLTGILGPSGGGKTTLLNVIAHRSKTGKTTGDVLYNNHRHSAEEVKQFSNYVMAHDKLHAYLTVEETLGIAARLKLPQLSKEQRRVRVEAVIREIGLTRCRSTYIGGEWKKGISSGEMKRVSIAVELLDNPKLLLLDEPTSGLDSNLALEVMQVLKNLCNAGRTIIISIHQPRSQVFSMIDRLILLTKGKVAFQGSPNVVREYFGNLGYPCPMNWNPADYILDLVSDGTSSPVEKDLDIPRAGLIAHNEGDYSVNVDNHAYRLSPNDVNMLNEKWVASELNQDLGNEISKVLNTHMEPATSQMKLTDRRHFEKQTWKNWFNQVCTLWKRLTLNSLRNPVVCCVMLLVQAMQGLILGGIFFQLSADVKGIQPITISEDWLNTTWAKVYSYGVDGNGTRPLVEVVENGVDGFQSRPLIEILNNATYTDFLHEVLMCAHTGYGLNDSSMMEGQPTYPPNQFTAPTAWPTVPSRVLNEMNELRSSVVQLIEDTRNDVAQKQKHVIGFEATFKADPAYADLVRELYEVSGFTHRNLEEGTTPGPPDAHQVVSDLITALQLIDYFIFRADYTEAEKCLDKTDDEWAFYLCVMTNANYLLDPLLLCLGFPALPSVPGKSNGDGIARLVETKKLGRRLMISGGISISSGSDFGGMLSPEMEVFIGATLDIIERISTCDNEICEAIATSLDSASSMMTDSMDTLLVVLNLAGCLFFAVANLGFASYDALLTFPQERFVFNHETANGLYRVSSYFIAKNIADLPFQLGPALTLSTLYYWMVGLAPTATQFFTYFGICAITTFTAYGFGYMVSAGSPRMEIAVLVAPMILVLWLVLAGFFLRDPDIPGWISWFKYFSFYRWSFFGLVTNQFPPGGYYGSFANEIVLAMCGITDTRLYFAALMLFVLAIGFRIIGFFLLKFTNRKVGIES